jgi:hypothetical protein
MKIQNNSVFRVWQIKQPKNVKYFNWSGSSVTNGARCTREIKSRRRHGKGSIQQDEDAFRQDIGLRFMAEASKVLYLGSSFVWWCNLDASEIPGKFSSVVLEKEGKVQLDRKCET